MRPSYVPSILTAVCVALLSCIHPCLAEVFENAAKDSGESPYIERMIATSDAQTLVLRFEGKLQLGRQGSVVTKSDGREVTFHSAVHQLVVILDNDALHETSITVAPDDSGALVVYPRELNVTVTSEVDYVELAIPKEMLLFSPVDVWAEISSMYYAQEGMVGQLGRNLFSGPEGAAVRLDVEELPADSTVPVLSDLKADEILPASITISWQTNRRTAAEVTIEAQDQPTHEVIHSHYSTEHKVAVSGLKPDTDYTVRATGTDFTGTKAQPLTLSIRTPALVQGSVQDAWLRVQGKSVVDSAGRPFVLGGYSVFLGEYWHNEFPRYGTHALQARYFRNLGFNSCRLGLLRHLPTHWSASHFRDEDTFKTYGSPEGYVKKFLDCLRFNHHPFK